MDWIGLSKRFTDAVKKYRYIILVLLIGVVMMSLPNRKHDTAQTPEPTTLAAEKATMDEDLASLLSQIDGAGKVHVMLTLAAGEETLYQTDANSNSETGSTVIITGSDRNQTGLVRQINPPSYLGAVIVCQGADSPAVRLSIVDAVSKITGLGADRISVLKMK